MQTSKRKWHALTFGVVQLPSVPSIACLRPPANWSHAFVAASHSSSYLFLICISPGATELLSSADSTHSVPRKRLLPIFFSLYERARARLFSIYNSAS